MFYKNSAMYHFRMQLTRLSGKRELYRVIKLPVSYHMDPQLKFLIIVFFYGRIKNDSLP